MEKKVTITKKLTIMASSLVLSLLSGVIPLATASATCSDNDIMHCGFSNRDDFIAKARVNEPGDLNAIYSRYGLDESEYDRFARNAKTGKSTPSGDIKVDGKVVATGGHSLGRKEKSNSNPVEIGSSTYHESALGDVTKYENDVLVLFNGDNEVEFVVMNLCGNPISFDQPASEPEPTPAETTKEPKIEVRKTVGDSYSRTLSAKEGDEFTYYIKVKNVGETKLTDIKIYDKPSTRITFLEVSEGKLNGGVWTHTISTLDVGEEEDFTVKAKLNAYNSFSQINKVCVDAKEIDGDKDDCDSAWVKPTKQEVKSSTTAKESAETPVEKGEETPKEVAKTGPAEAFGAVLGLGSLAGAGYYWRSGRKTFLKKALSRR